MKTDTMGAGPDTDGDGIPDQWELSKVSSLTTLTATGDYDGDKGEYASDTHPNNSASYMEILDYDQRRKRCQEPFFLVLFAPALRLGG